MTCTVELKSLAFLFLTLASPGPPRYLQWQLYIACCSQGAIITQWKFHVGRGRDVENDTSLNLSA